MTHQPTLTNTVADPHLMLAFEGMHTPGWVAQFLESGRPAGLTLFRGWNIESPSQVAELVSELQQRNRGEAPLLIATDQESSDLGEVPTVVAAVLELEPAIEAAADRFVDIEHCAVIARGYNHATASEWALKLQELTYAVSQPFSTADFLHGPIAVLEPGYPVLAIASTGPTLEDVSEVIARSLDAEARVMIITDDESTAGLSETSILIPAGGLPEWLTPIPFVVACQLFAYHLTRAKGLDVESPRGLQKVTRTL